MNCENCSSPIDSEIVINGRLKLNQQLSVEEISKLNELTNQSKQSYCTNCGPNILKNENKLKREQENSLNLELEKLLSSIPIITSSNPQDLKYETIGIVTAQSTIGTGAITEIKSSFTDILGLASSDHNKKLRKGEQDCFLQLRLKTFQLGGNCVIATDLDYSEIGSLKGILMVCASGTAVRISNTNELNLINSNALMQIEDIRSKLNSTNN